MNIVTGFHPDGKQAFKSQNLRGLNDYARKHGIARVELGECISKVGLYRVTFGNGVVCKGDFADPRIMLGFFFNHARVTEIECDRGVFNKGTAMGRVSIPFLLSLERDVPTSYAGLWTFLAFRDAHGTPLVKMTR